MSQSAMKEIPYSVGKIEVTTPDFSYLGTARVCIKRPMRSSKLSRCIVYAGSQSTFTNEILSEALQMNVAGTKDLVVTSE
jgi:hypothetical protein